jgi:hypothetical protein
MNGETFVCLGAGRWQALEAVDHGANVTGDRELGIRLCNSMCYVP